MRWLLRLIPFASELDKCSWSDLRQAGAELFVVTVFATLPLWLFPVLGPIIFLTEISFLGQLGNTVQSGELFLYCAALMGPLFYIIMKRYGEFSRDEGRYRVTISFPQGLFFVVFAALVCIIAAVSFSLMRNPVFNAIDAKIGLNRSGIFWFSIILYAACLYSVFCAACYRNAMESFVDDHGDRERAFAQQLRERRDAR